MKFHHDYTLNALLIVSALGFLLLMLCGCSKQENTIQTDLYPDMPKGLRTLQGSWTAINTNDAVACSAVFQGYTIRIRFQTDQEVSQLKQNVSIQQLDEEHQLILINGGTGAWPYEYSLHNGIEILNLEFYTSDGWKRMELCRTL